MATLVSPDRRLGRRRHARRAARRRHGGRALGARRRAIDSALIGGRQHARRRRAAAERRSTGSPRREGAPIPRVYGRARIGGQMIWATRFEEVATDDANARGGQGGKGVGGGGQDRDAPPIPISPTSRSACARGRSRSCGGSGRTGASSTSRRSRCASIAATRRQPPDPLIVAKEGAATRRPIAASPMWCSSACRSATSATACRSSPSRWSAPVDGLGRHDARRVPDPRRGRVRLRRPRRHAGRRPRRDRGPRTATSCSAAADVVASLDALAGAVPEPRARVAGGRLVRRRSARRRLHDRAARRDAAKVDRRRRHGPSPAWRAPSAARRLAGRRRAGLRRHAVGRQRRRAPIQDLKARGLEVTLYPFVMMDVPAGNALPDPWTGAPGQPAYPWRGRITCDPAPGAPASPDGTLPRRRRSQRSSARRRRLRVAATRRLSGPASGATAAHPALRAPRAGRRRRRRLHHRLGARGLTRVRSASGVYPAVAQLVDARRRRARRCSAPATKIVYARRLDRIRRPCARRRRRGALSARSAVGARRRSTRSASTTTRRSPTGATAPDHADLADRRAAVYDRRLPARPTSRGGEAFDWYYADAADRAARRRARRSPTAPTASPGCSAPRTSSGWWSNPHVERVGGVELPRRPPGCRSRKPIWLTEIGCPAVDKGANAAERLPRSEVVANPACRHSRAAARDDLIQARDLEAILSRFDPALRGYPAGAQSRSRRLRRPMVDPGHVFVWAWDARPFPAFPDFDRRLGRRRQLGDRPLDHRPARGRAARPR